MSLLGKTSWWQKILGSRVTVLVLLVLVIGLSVAVFDRYVVEKEVKERRETKETELQNLKDRQALLEERVSYLQNDQGMEAEIRRHFDVAREGEQVVVLVGEKEDEPSTTPPLSQETKIEVGFWSWLWPW